MSHGDIDLAGWRRLWIVLTPLSPSPSPPGFASQRLRPRDEHSTTQRNSRAQ